jgi:asparagine synthase (glutamine-hydrolysing)
LDRPRLSSPTSTAVRRENLTYLSARKLDRLEQCVDLALKKNVPGAVLEFGVALGGSGIVLAARCGERAFHGFDLFGLIPAPTSEKDDLKSKQRHEIIASGRSKGIGGEMYYGYRKDLFSEVVAAFARHHCPVDNKRVFLHKGLFDQTWPNFPPTERVAVAHIDCDWYDPVKFCLAAVSPLLSQGSILILDDYHEYGGCRAAVQEFLDNSGVFAVDAGENVLLMRR